MSTYAAADPSTDHINKEYQTATTAAINSAPPGNNVQGHSSTVLERVALVPHHGALDGRRADFATIIARETDQSPAESISQDKLADAVYRFHGNDDAVRLCHRGSRQNRSAEHRECPPGFRRYLLSAPHLCPTLFLHARLPLTAAPRRGPTDTRGPLRERSQGDPKKPIPPSSVRRRLTLWHESAHARRCRRAARQIWACDPINTCVIPSVILERASRVKKGFPNHVKNLISLS